VAPIILFPAMNQCPVVKTFSFAAQPSGNALPSKAWQALCDCIHKPQRSVSTSLRQVASEFSVEFPLSPVSV
jgi:hypothetical protein